MFGLQYNYQGLVNLKDNLIYLENFSNSLWGLLDQEKKIKEKPYLLIKVN